MPAPLSMDVRERILRACQAGLSTQEQIARTFGVTRQCLWALRRRYRQTGSVAAKPHGGGQTAAYGGAKLEELRRCAREQPDATLEELRERTGVACSLVTVHNTLRRLGLRFKKSRSGPASRSGRR